MGANKDLGLPTNSGMQKVLVVFDVDGTLVPKDTTKVHASTMQLLLAFNFQKWKNVDVAIWSGGGKEYAEDITRRHLRSVSPLLNVKFYSKLEYAQLQQKYDVIVALDDIQDTAIGTANLIVRNK